MKRRLNHTDRQIRFLINDRLDTENWTTEDDYAKVENALVDEIVEKFDIDPDSALDHIWQFCASD